MKKLIFLFLFLLLLMGCTKKNYDGLAKCLTEKGVVMYGTEWCSHCNNQKKEFGSSFRYINFTDCDNNKEECTNAGIEGYPTWIMNGTKYPGEQPLDKLSALARCDSAAIK
jgi:hypothetical protein